MNAMSKIFSRIELVKNQQPQISFDKKKHFLVNSKYKLLFNILKIFFFFSVYIIFNKLAYQSLIIQWVFFM